MPRSVDQHVMTETSENKPKTLAEEVVEQIKAQNTLFPDQRQEPYIAVGKTGGQVVKLTSKEFERWLRNYLIKKYQKIQGLDAIVDIIQTMLIYEAETNGEYHELSTRLCRTDDCKGNPMEIVYDVRDGTHVINITPENGQFKTCQSLFSIITTKSRNAYLSDMKIAVLSHYEVCCRSLRITESGLWF